jgi:hypothetical protein
MLANTHAAPRPRMRQLTALARAAMIAALPACRAARPDPTVVSDGRTREQHGLRQRASDLIGNAVTERQRSAAPKASV